MANISSKISSIEPDDGDTVRAAGLSPDPKPDVKKADVVTHDRRQDDKVPEFLLSETSKIDPLISAAPPSFGWINIVIILSSLLWILTACIVVYSFFDLGSGLAAFTALQWAGLALFVMGPVLMLWVTGYALRQLARLSLQAHQLSVTAQQLLTPDDTAVSRTALMANSIRKEMELVSNRVDVALSRMSTLGETLEGQLSAINETTYATENKSEIIAKRLSEERVALTMISASFDGAMKVLSSTLDTHGENLAKSTKAAEQKIREARISVEGATAKINSASELVLANTVEAASKLDNNQSEISRLGRELKVRAEELDNLYSKHATDLTAMISELRDEQENLGSSLEARLQKMRDMSLSAQVSAQHLTEASTSGQKTVQALADAARLTDGAVKQRFAEMEKMVVYSNQRAESIAETAARRVQDSLGQTRREISRIEYDMISLQDKLKRSEEVIKEAPAPETLAPLKQTETETVPVLAKRRGISGLRPLPETEDIDFAIPKAPSAETPNAPPAKTRLSGLRPAPDPEETFEAPQKFGDEMGPKASNAFKEEDPHELLIPKIMDLDLHDQPIEMVDDIVLVAPTEDDLAVPDPDQHLLQFKPDILRRTVSNEEEILSKPEAAPRKSWWKNLLPGGQGSETSAIDQLTAVTKPSPPPASDPDIIMTLSGLGLAPGAVVNDGSIIEAVNARVSKGPLAMSGVVSNRLEDPVRHLYDASASDPELHEKLTHFARRFHESLSEIEDNREALRSRFESDAGRAFLLCDAALNL